MSDPYEDTIFEYQTARDARRALEGDAGDTLTEMTRKHLDNVMALYAENEALEQAHEALRQKHAAELRVRRAAINKLIALASPVRDFMGADNRKEFDSIVDKTNNGR